MTRRTFEPPASFASFSPLALGRYPTPVEPLPGLSVAGAELWVKRDDRTHEAYGGNKVRKLEWLLAEARARAASRVVTLGAVGSHHVLATAYFGFREGFDVRAAVVGQPATDHVVDVMRADLALGLRPVPARTWPGAAAAAWALSAGRRARLVPVGGSSVTGCMGYVAAARELAAQVRAGALPEPDLCVVALGSGGTAAGLAAGLAHEGLKTRVVGVCVSEPRWAVAALGRRLARACARRLARTPPPFSARREVALDVDGRFLGRGYGHPTEEGREATRLARSAGLALDPTYTAKAFASTLWHARARAGRVVLYWHTLSSAPLEPLICAGPGDAALESRLRALLT